MTLRHVLVVARKELTDALRDRRSLFSALVFPLFGPLLVVAMLSTIIEQQQIDETVHLPVVGAEHAPGLVQHLRQHDIEVEAAPSDPKATVRAGDVPAVLIVPPEYGERFRAGRSITVELVSDSSRKETRSSVRRVERALQSYSAELGFLRLLARGVDPQLTRPVVYASVDLATSRQQAADLLGTIVPMFVIMAAFIGGMYVAIDGTAGERERGSLEPLLVNPVRRMALVGGKWIATAAMASLSVVLTITTLSVALEYVPFDELDLPAHLGAADGVALAMVMVPLAWLAAGLQLVVGSVTRSFREAQTYLSLLTIVPIVPNLYATATSLDPAPWMYATPMLAQQVMMLSVLRGETIEPLPVGIASVITIVLALACVAVTARLFSREKTIFGG